MKVLIACEESQRICIEFRKRGHEAYSCDIQECSGGHPEWHICGDALALINGDCFFETEDGVKHLIEGKWDLLIAHPPCTYLTVAGATSLFNKDHSIKSQERYEKGLEAKEFFLRFYNADCPHICVENPLPMKIWELPPYTQIIHPHYFGSEFQKRTCLWLKNLPPLRRTHWIENPIPTSKADWYQRSGKDRQKNRSKTFPEVAFAIAEQWNDIASS